MARAHLFGYGGTTSNLNSITDGSSNGMFEVGLYMGDDLTSKLNLDRVYSVKEYSIMGTKYNKFKKGVAPLVKVPLNKITPCNFLPWYWALGYYDTNKIVMTPYGESKIAVDLYTAMVEGSDTQYKYSLASKMQEFTYSFSIEKGWVVEGSFKGTSGGLYPSGSTDVVNKGFPYLTSTVATRLDSPIDILESFVFDVGGTDTSLNVIALNGFINEPILGHFKEVAIDDGSTIVNTYEKVTNNDTITSSLTFTFQGFNSIDENDYDTFDISFTARKSVGEPTTKYSGAFLYEDCVIESIATIRSEVDDSPQTSITVRPGNISITPNSTTKLDAVFYPTHA